MDFWVVAAATGAGYVAKHWHNLSGEKDSPSKLLPVLSQRVQSDAYQVTDKMPNSVFPMPKLTRRCFLEGDVSSPEEEYTTAGMNLFNHNKLPVSDPASIFTEKRVFQENMNEINGNHEFLDFSDRHVNGYITKRTKSKSFSSLRPLVDRKIELTEENRAFFEPAGSVKLPRRQKQTDETRNLNRQGNDMASLFLGITIGILSSSVTTQREVEHLNDLLEQAENMVRDLHNRLETKDGFTTNEHITATTTPKVKNLELTSDIEAELEAELERLEENMKDHTLHMSYNVAEIDSDYEADMAREDLNVDALPWRSESRSESDHCDNYNENERVFTPNYAVSSLDLRIRLHEVIESELRARIEELEAALKNQNSQIEHCSPKGIEPQEENSFWDFDHTRIESSSSTP